MLSTKLLEKYVAYREVNDLRTVPTAELIEELRNRAGVNFDAIDYEETIKATVSGPKILLTVSFFEEDNE